MRRNLLSITALLAILTGSLATLGKQGISWRGTSTEHLEATLIVRDANGLMPRSRVLLRGVPIGQVTRVRAAADGVSVDFWYPNTIQLPVNSTFRIDTLSVLGGAFLSIKPRSADGPVLEDHQRIAADEDSVGGTFGDQAVAAVRLLKGLDPARINIVVEELNTALSDASLIPRLANSAARTRDDVRANEDQLRKILVAAQSLLQNTGSAESVLPTLATPVADVGKQVQIMVETIIELLYSGNYPGNLQDGVKPLVDRLIKFSGDTALNTYNLTNPLLPPMQATAAAFATIDVSRFLDGTMATAEAPGAYTVHVLPTQ